MSTRPAPSAAAAAASPRRSRSGRGLPRAGRASRTAPGAATERIRRCRGRRRRGPPRHSKAQRHAVLGYRVARSHPHSPAPAAFAGPSCRLPPRPDRGPGATVRPCIASSSSAAASAACTRPSALQGAPVAGHAHRPPQLPPLPAAAVPGRHGRAVARRTSPPRCAASCDASATPTCCSARSPASTSTQRGASSSTAASGSPTTR